MKLSKTQVQDMLASLQSCERIIKRLGENEVDVHALSTAKNLLSQLSLECAEIIGGSRYEADMKRKAKI